MDVALVQYINRLCRHLAITPARLHPHEVYLDTADAADPRISCLLSTYRWLLQRESWAVLLGCHPGGWDFPWRLQVGVCVGEGEHQARVYSLQTVLGCSAALARFCGRGSGILLAQDRVVSLAHREKEGQIAVLGLDRPESPKSCSKH